MKDDSFFLLCANPVDSANADSIRSRLEPLHTMSHGRDQAGLQEGAARRNAGTDSKGAGLGFLTMARDASEPLEFEFVQDEHNPDTTVFCIKAII